MRLQNATRRQSSAVNLRPTTKLPSCVVASKRLSRRDIERDWQWRSKDERWRGGCGCCSEQMTQLWRDRDGYQNDDDARRRREGEREQWVCWRCRDVVIVPDDIVIQTTLTRSCVLWISRTSSPPVTNQLFVHDHSTSLACPAVHATCMMPVWRQYCLSNVICVRDISARTRSLFPQVRSTPISTDTSDIFDFSDSFFQNLLSNLSPCINFVSGWQRLTLVDAIKE